MSRDSAVDPIWKSSSRTWLLPLGACTQSPALPYQAFPDDVSIKSPGVGLFVDWPNVSMQISQARGLFRNPNPEGEHFVNCDNHVDICGYFIYSSVPRIGASIINL